MGNLKMSDLNSYIQELAVYEKPYFILSKANYFVKFLRLNSTSHVCRKYPSLIVRDFFETHDSIVPAKNLLVEGFWEVDTCATIKVA